MVCRICGSACFARAMGPWTTVLYEREWGKGHVSANTFYWNFTALVIDCQFFVSFDFTRARYTRCCIGHQTQASCGDSLAATLTPTIRLFGKFCECLVDLLKFLSFQFHNSRLVAVFTLKIFPRLRTGGEHPSPQRLWPSTHQGDNKCVPANPAKLGRLSKVHHHRIDSPYLCGCQRVRKHSTGTARAQPVHTNPPKHANCRLSNVIWIPVAGGRQCVCRAIIRSRGDATPKHLASVETTASGRPSAPTSVPVIATNCCL
jgi:hypothetical protein